jgi:hypothetical protein
MRKKDNMTECPVCGKKYTELDSLKNEHSLTLKRYLGYYIRRIIRLISD